MIIKNDIIKVEIANKFNTFKKEMERIINSLSIDSILETPDYILAQYLYDSLTIFGMALAEKNKHKE